MTPCDSPISFLRLERYHLGELPAGETEAVRAHLGGCEACTATLAGIAKDDAHPLPALPATAEPATAEPASAEPATAAPATAATDRATATPPRAGASSVSIRRRAWPVAGALAMAAAALLFLSRPTPQPQGDTVRVKGDGVAFGLVRDDDATFEEGGASFRDGDRFKVVVTCPPHLHTRVDVVVWENGVPSFPLTSDQIACGNKVPLPGAFRVTGATSMTVCLLVSDAGIDRDRVRQAGPGSADQACKVLTPAP